MQSEGSIGSTKDDASIPVCEERAGSGDMHACARMNTKRKTERLVK